ncbi:hypothetical protein ACFQY7_53500 [Actinomadura luteofluorescens]|uniref:hypothetical protein n=1 Tax=Actinomadura luteofluorescens TaxID=46163 RepID=UPI00362FA915
MKRREKAARDSPARAPRPATVQGRAGSSWSASRAALIAGSASAAAHPVAPPPAG